LGAVWIINGCWSNFWSCRAGAGMLTQGLQVYGAIPGALIEGRIQGAAGGLAGGFGNVIMEDDWGVFGSGFATGFILGGISGGIEGYKNVQSVGANPWSGKLYTNDITYSTTPKNGIPLQPNPERDCYGYALEYADAGHGNRNASHFLSQTGNAPGADPELVARSSDIHINRGFTGCVNSASAYEGIGRQLAGGKEIIGVMSRGGQGHAVNLTSITTADKLRIIGGGYKQVLRSTSIWDPIVGHTTGTGSFLKNITLF